MKIRMRPSELPALVHELRAMSDRVAERVRLARQEHGDHYAARFYRCNACESISGACAPADELTDAYPCASCGRPQQPLTGVRIPHAA